MYLTILEWLGQHLPVPLQYSRLVGKLVKLRDVVRSHIGPANGADLRSGTEVLVQKVFHLPSPCAIFYQLRLIALFVNVMNLYNNGLIMTMIMLIMMSLIIAGIASGKTFFVKHFQSHFLQCLQCHFQLQCIQRHFLWCAKLFGSVSIISPKVPPNSLQNCYHQHS